MKKNFTILSLVFFLVSGFAFAYNAWAQETDIQLESPESAPSQDSSSAEFDPEVDPASLGPEVYQRSETVPLNPEVKINLNDCVQMALLNNKEIRSTDYDVEAAEYKLKQAQVRGIPTIEYEFISAPAPRDVDRAVSSFFEGDLTYFQKGKLAMGLPLYAFGKLTIAQRLAKSGIQAEKQKKIQKQNEVVLNVNKLYYGILLAKDLRELLQDAINHLEDEIRRREGSEEPTDPVELARLKLYRFEVLSRLSQIEKKGFLAKEGLKIQMGLARGTDYEIEEQHLAPVDFELEEFEKYLEQSQKYRPKTNLLKIGLKAKEEQYRLEKRKAAPDIGFGGFYEFGRTTNSIQGLQLTDDFNDPFNFNRVGFGLRLQGKINPKSYIDKVRESRAEYFKTAFQKKAADEGLELDLKDAYLGVQQSQRNLENNREAMQTARQYVFITKSNVDIGIGDKKDYSDALQTYLLTRGRYLEAVFNYNIAVATLKQKTGGVALEKAQGERYENDS